MRRAPTGIPGDHLSRDGAECCCRPSRGMTSPSIMIQIKACTRERLCRQDRNLVGVSRQPIQRSLEFLRAEFVRRRPSCCRSLFGNQMLDIALRRQPARLNLRGEFVRDFDRDLHGLRITNAPWKRLPFRLGGCALTENRTTVLCNSRWAGPVKMNMTGSVPGFTYPV